MSIGPVRALSPGRVFRWRTALLAISLLFSTFTLPPFLGLDSPWVPAGAVVTQGDAVSCEAFGTNWTSCPNAFASDDLYAYANASSVPSVIQQAGNTTHSANASSWSFSHAVPAGLNRFLLLAVATDNGQAVSGTPQYGTASFVFLTTILHSIGRPRVTVYGLVAPAVGTALVTGNLAAADNYTVGAVSYTGVNQTVPGDNITTGQGAAGTQIVIDVPSEVGDLVVDFTANIGVNPLNVGGGQNETYQDEMGGPGTTNHFATSSEEAGASSVQMRWNGKENGKEWVSAGLNLNRAPPTAGPAVRDTAWRGFGFTLDPADEVQVVEVGIEWWRNNTAPLLNVTVSWDGGTTWATNQTATNKSADDDTVEWLDFTAATAWNASNLRDSNLRVRVGTDFAGARLDYVTVRTTYNDAPEVSNLRIEDAMGQSKAGGLLDPNVSYRFLLNVTDEDGWADIGADGAVALRMWYDGNVTPELAFAEQTNGSDYRIELRYEDLFDPGNATLDEWRVVEGSATYDASASGLTAILNGTTLIGYEFNLSLTLWLTAKAASDPTNATPGTYNDPDSWNVEATAFDGSVGGTQPRAAGGEHMEFGVFALALMAYSASVSPTTIQPGDSAVFRVDFENAGQGAASRVWVNLTFPAELSYVSDDAALIGGVRSCCEDFAFTNVSPGPYSFNITASAEGGVANGTVVWTNFTYQALDAQGRPINQSAEDLSVTIVNAVMSFVVSASPTTLQPGDTTVFRVDFTNAGQGDAATVWVNVTLPAELSYVSDDAAAIGGIGTCCHDYAFTNVAPGTYSFNLTAMANGGIANGTVATTSFSLQAVDAAGAPLNPSSQDVDVTLANGILSYAVAPADPTLNPGEATVFQVTFTNSGDGEAGFVYVNMTLDPALAYVGDDAASIGGITLCCYSFQFANVGPGTYRFNITVRANGGFANGTVAATNFTFEAVDPLGAPLQASAETESITIHNADMGLLVGVDPSAIGPGALTTFTITFSNSGLANASIVWINVTLPPELVYLSDDAALIGGVLSGTYSFAFTDVVPGVHTFNLTVSSVGGIPNGTVVSTSFVLEALDLAGASLGPSNVDVSVTLQNAVMTFAVVASPTSLEPGDNATFTIWFNATGLYPAERVWVNVTLPLGLSYVSDTAASIGGVVSGTYSFAFSTILPGTYAFLLVTRVDGGVPDGSGLLTNLTLELLDSLLEPLPPASQDAIVAVTHASFAPVLLLAPLRAERGDELLATVYYNNTGSGPSGAVWLNWTLNGHFQLLGLTPLVPFTTTADGFDVALLSVGSGPQRLDARLRVLRGLDDNLTMALSVAFASTYRNGNPLDAAGLASAATLAAPRLELSLTTSAAQLVAGDPLLLTVTVRNTGGAAASGWLNLTLPAGVAYLGDDGTFTVTEAATGVSWSVPSIAAGAVITLEVTLTAENALGLQSFRFTMAFTDGRGSPPLSAISNAVTVQFGPGASTPPPPWMWLLLAALAGGIALFLLTRRLWGPSIDEVFVVHENGVLIAHRSKTLTPDKDEDVLAAMLSTVQSFIRDAFTEHEDTPVRGLQFDKFSILVEQGTHHYVAVVFQGRENGALRARLHQLSARIEAEFGEVLAGWRGTSSEVQPLKALLPLLWGKRLGRGMEAGENADANDEAKSIEAETESVGEPPEPESESSREGASETPVEGGSEERPEEPSEVEDEAVDESAPAAKEATVPSAPLTREQIWDATETQLREWCRQFGLDDTGPIMNLRLRLQNLLESDHPASR